MLLEACVDTVESALAAEQGGADRIELCADLADAGTTPSHGALALALERLHIPVFPIIRPRGGGFVYDDDAIAVMRADLRHARDLGASGAVVGALAATGDIAGDVVAMLREDAPEMQLTFHRAFDVTPDPHAALETLIALGINRVLTSGQAQTAWDGRDTIAGLVRQSTGRVIILAGGGVDETNAGVLVKHTGVAELHVRGTRERREPSPGRRVKFRKPLPDDETARAVTDAGRIRSIRAAVSHEKSGREP